MYVLPALLLSGLFVAYPIVATVRASFLDWYGISGDKTWVGLGNYREMIGGLDPYFWQAARNTILWMVVTVPAQLVIGLSLALLLNSSLRGRVFYRTVFFLPAVLSSVVVAFAWSWIFNPQDGVATQLLQSAGFEGQAWLADKTTALPAAMAVSVWRYMGFSMLFYLAAMQTIPRDLYEAARIDGAGWWQQARHITIPLLAPMTALLSLLGVIGALREFEVVYILTRGGPAHGTDLLSIQVFQQAFEQSRPGYAAAIATSLLVLTAVSAIALLAWIARANRGVK